MKQFTYFFLICLSFQACTSTKELSAPASLYKSPEGKNIAYKSYDAAMDLWNMDYNEEYVETAFGSTHIIISGEENEQALFLVPGLFADACMWYPNVKALSEHYRVYTLDMLTYGGKGQPSGNAITDIDDYKLWVRQIMEHYGLEKVAMAGLSYSSWLTLALAREMPGKLGSIILLDPSETFMPMNGGIAWKGFKAFMFFPNREKYNDFFTWIGGGYMDPQMDIWFEHMLDVIEYGSVGMMDVPMHRTYEAAELEMVNMPVLVMAGGKPILYKDPEVFRANAQKALPHAEVVIVPDAGHGLNMERPDYVNEKMISFLQQNYLKGEIAVNSINE